MLHEQNYSWLSNHGNKLTERMRGVRQTKGFLLLILLLFSACSLHKKHAKFVEAEKQMTIANLYKSALDTLQKAENNVYEGLPRQLDLKPFQTIVKDQNERLTCAYFAFCGLMESYYLKEYGKKLNLSEEYLIGLSKEKYYGVMENTNLGVPLTTFLRKGIVTESHWPYQPSWFQYGFPYFGYNDGNLPENKLLPNIPPAELQQDVQNLDFTCFNNIRGLTKTIKALAKDSLPLIGIMILTRDQYQHCDSLNGPIKKTTLSAYRNVNDTTGEIGFEIPKIYKVVQKDTIYVDEMTRSEWDNHFVLYTGYDLDQQRFYFKNSWGVGFGDNGYGFISFSEFQECSRYSLRISKEKNVNFNLPADTASQEDAADLSNPVVNVAQTKNGALSINLSAELTGKSPGLVLVNHVIYLEPKNETSIDHSKAILAKLSAKDSLQYGDAKLRCAWHTPKSSIGKQLTWTTSDPLKLSIGAEKIKKLLTMNANNEMNYVLRTSVAMYSDTKGMTQLKEIWSNLILTKR